MNSHHAQIQLDTQGHLFRCVLTASGALNQRFIHTGVGAGGSSVSQILTGTCSVCFIGTFKELGLCVVIMCSTGRRGRESDAKCCTQIDIVLMRVGPPVVECVIICEAEAAGGTGEWGGVAQLSG